jgi:hypothetical protein
MPDSFYELDSSWVPQRYHAEWDCEAMESASEVVRCVVNPGHQRRGRRVRDLSVVLPDIGVQDFVWTWYSECLLQDRTLELLRASGFTGFEVKPVAARFETSAKPAPRLWELVVTGWGGMAAPESGIRLDESKSCPVCGLLAYTGLNNPSRLIDAAEWDGSDFFMVWPMCRSVFVTQRVVDVIRAHGLTGDGATALARLAPINRLNGGRLRWYFPEKRAREIGEPLGIY